MIEGGDHIVLLQRTRWQRWRTHTIRTQSLDLVSAGRRAVAEWDHDFQRIFADDNSFDQQIQQDLPFFERRVIQARTDALAKCIRLPSTSWARTFAA